jgi:hypothetical protein
VLAEPIEEPAKPRAEAPPPVKASAPAPVVPAPEPAKPVATGPEATCSGRNPVMYFICMERECLRSEFGSHADCQKWRRNARRD